MIRLSVILLALLALVAAPLPALAQPQGEPVTDAPPQSTSSEPDPDEAGQPATEAEAEAEAQSRDGQPASHPYASPSYAPPPAPRVSIPDGVSLENRIRASAAAAQGLQGPLDGGWTVRTDDGTAVYGLQLVDTAAGSLEGAWRDLRRTGAMGARGVIGGLYRTGGELMIRFYPREGADPVVLQLNGYGDDVWSGSLWESSGPETAVSVTRNEKRPVVDYASGAWSTRPAGERPVRVRQPTSSREQARPSNAKGKKGKAAKASKAGKGKKAGKAVKKSGKAAPKKTTTRKKGR